METPDFYRKLRLSHDYFTHASELHGIEHTYRVMVLLHTLTNLLNLKDLTVPGLAAAFIHDMAREHDGYCTQHGKWAAEKKLPAFKSFFLKQGLDHALLDDIAIAVEYHSLAQELNARHPAYSLTALLKDADALDRVRLGDANLDIRFLRFPESRELIGFSKALYLSGRNTNFHNFAEALEFSNRINQK